jgi:hypothetical protein
VLPSASAPPLYGEVTFPLARQNLNAPETTAENAINYNIDASNHLKGETNDCRGRLEDLEDGQADLEVLVQRLIGEVVSLRAEVERLQFMVDRPGGSNSGGPVSIYNPDEQLSQLTIIRLLELQVVAVKEGEDVGEEVL